MAAVKHVRDLSPFERMAIARQFVNDCPDDIAAALRERAVGPDVPSAISDMGRALHALRLEVTTSVADDVAARWGRLLTYIEGIAR
jgi:hypothetical protein